MALANPAVTSVPERLERVKENIAEAAARAGRDPSEVRLIAVSKGFGPEAIAAAFEAGQVDFGENRVQELHGKYAQVPAGVRWHFVGRLQRNKVTKLVRIAQTIHSIDSVKLAEEVSVRAEEPVEALIEVNLSGEARKGGVDPEGVDELVEAALQLPRLEVIGLMTMARRVADPEEARPVFRRLAELRSKLAQRYSYARIHHLSMGMSQDYRVGVEEGATMVRVGEAIFGPRAVKTRSEER